MNEIECLIKYYTYKYQTPYPRVHAIMQDLLYFLHKGSEEAETFSARTNPRDSDLTAFYEHG